MAHQPDGPRFTGRNFTVDGAHLTIYVTDVTETTYPPDEMEDTEKGVRWYRKEAKTSPTSLHWRHLIANELCIKYLGYPPDLDYILTGFPDGYHLYTCNEGTSATTKASQNDIRTDAYLYGAEGGPRFRSPQEFLYHCAWILRGMPPNRCRCVYHTRNKKFKRRQGPLNKAVDKDYHEYVSLRVKRVFDEKMACFRSGKEYYPSPQPVDPFLDEIFLEPEPAN